MSNMDNELNAIEHLRDWTPAPSPPQAPIPYPNRLIMNPHFHAVVRRSHVPPPLVRDDEEIAVAAHPLPLPPPSPEPESEDDEVIITRHVLPPGRPHPPPLPPREPEPPLLACRSCGRPLWAGWRLPCGHVMDDKCYRERTGEVTEEDLRGPPFELELDCPARVRGGCMGCYRSEMVRVSDRWTWQPKNGVRRWRAW
ncbi:hypothetical protein FS749_007936 [Ceratobasidium sp. UAMH 11750]|nr:hypothetical protein FS749_007936 [Ceratobasidium sp. UAMH 11750]